MEENRNDRALREKLRSAEYNFDPAAWSQMEAMLDKKDKRKIAVWWWLSGAAVLIISAVVAFTFTASDKTAEKGQTSMLPQTRSGFHSPRTTVSSDVVAIAQASGHVAGPQSDAHAAIVAKSQSNFVSFSGHSANRASRIAGAGRSVGAPGATEVYSDKDVKEQKQAQTGKAAAFINYANDLTIAMLQAREIEQNSLTPEMDKQGDQTDLIPAKHRKNKIAIHYGLGISGQVSEAFIAKTFAGKPSWGIGLSEDLRIGKYMGVNTGILYSETNFTINRPKYPEGASTFPLRYTDHLREILIPIGIKCYPYTKGGLSLHVGIAYVNHIKLKETLEYQLVSVNNSMTGSEPQTYVNDVNFNPKAVALTTANADPNATTTKYFSLAGGQRYYGGLLFTAGLDYVIRKHLVISAEPALNMSLAKVPMQDARLYNFGLNLGLKYGF